MTSHRLEARHASKTFGSTRVLDDVDLLVEPGEIHALVGQNGSGKSTVVKILTGYHAPDPGMTLAVDGQAIDLPVHRDMLRQVGVSVVHQDLGLLDHLTVSENIGVGGYRHSKVLRRINWRRQDQIAQAVLDRLHCEASPRALVGSLPFSQRAEVGIARALRDQEPGQGLMILDEATRALPREDLLRFHQLLKRVVADGTSVLMVSHNLEEVLALSDRVTVLRDGRVAGAGLATASLSEADIARLMLGRTVGAVAGRGPRVAEQPVCLEATGLVVDDRLPVDIRVRAGEVVGLTGLPGTGFESLPYVIGGARRATEGTITTPAGRMDVAKATPVVALRLGIALVPERRDRDGLAFEMSIRENIALPSIARRGRRWFVGRGWQKGQAAEAISRLSIRARDAAMLVKELSGGNQQKVLFAKWTSVQPRVLVLHEPTQAVDVGARQDILQAIIDSASGGTAVLLASAEPTDLVEVCDRILVLSGDGQLRELRTTDPDDVLGAVYSGAPMQAGDTR